MGIKELNSFKELYDEIEKDKQSYSIINRRFSTRFIFINSFKELRDLVKNLGKKLGKEEIVNLLRNENLWITSTDILGLIKNISHDTIIVSLSEFLRFQNKKDFYNTIKMLSEIENNNIRLYIPLVGLWTRFNQDFWKNFYRKNEWAPVWKLNSYIQINKIKIYQIAFKLRNLDNFSEQFTIISSTEDWLNIWKTKNIKKIIISSSKTLEYFYDNFLPDQIFESKKIYNQKNLLEEMYNTKINIKYNEKESEFWNKLIIKFLECKDNQPTVEKIFSKDMNFQDIKKLESKDYLTFYLRNNDHYTKWVIKNTFLGLNKFKNSYLHLCFKGIDKLENKNLIEKLWLHIFTLSREEIKETMFIERKQLLYLIHKNLNFNYQFIENSLSYSIDNINSHYTLEEKFLYLTNITFAEKYFIINEISKLNIEDIEKNLYILKDIYPELAYYLDWNSIKPDNKIDKWIIDYFREYNYSKLRNSKSLNIENLINTYNSNKSTFSNWYYSLPKPEIENSYKYIWIDGLGAEWFPLIIHIINKHIKNNLTIKIKKLVRSSLPTTTECNKYQFEKIEELDNYIHKENPYKYPDDLINEIEIIKNIVKNVLDKCDGETCIVSDHGFSFLCIKKFDNFKRLNFENAEHDGRFMWNNQDNIKDSNYFITWNIDEGNCNNKNALIALKHVSLNNTPYREVHGGATPEEIITSYIVIKTVDKEKKSYKIKPTTFTTNKNNPFIKLTITPVTSSINAMYKNKPLKVSFEKNNFWKIDLTPIKSGKHTIIIKIKDTSHEIKVTIKGGFEEEELL